VAGLLTCLRIGAFPVSQWRLPILYLRLTAAGTVPDFHRIPFSSRTSGNQNTNANVNLKTHTLFNPWNFWNFKKTVWRKIFRIINQ
jgi:hypothetical protein